MIPGVKTTAFLQMVLGGLLVAGLLVAELGFGIHIDDNTKTALLGAVGLQAVYVSAHTWLQAKLGGMNPISNWKSTEFISVLVTVIGVVGLTVADSAYNLQLSDSTKNLILGALAMQSAYVVGRKYVKASTVIETQTSSATGNK